MPHKCEHKRKEPSGIKDNLTGLYYEWTCKDCGYKKGEGRSYAHKEIIEYAQRLRSTVRAHNKEDSLKCLRMVREMAIDAIKRLESKSRGYKYFKDVF